MNHIFVILGALIGAKILSAAVDVAAGHPVTSIGPVEMWIVIQVGAAIANGMPHPSVIRTMGMTEFLYTWVYNSINILFQNLAKQYHPVPGEKTIEVERTSTTSVKTGGMPTEA